MEEFDQIEEKEEVYDGNFIEENRKGTKIPLKFKVIVVLAVIAAGLVLILTIQIWRKAKTYGENIGDVTGKTVGIAVGSFHGFSEGKRGREDGKEDGLSASDTVANLQVLVSSIKLNDYHKLEEKYAALYLLKGDAVFTVDLSKAVIDANEDGEVWYIRLPQPEVTVYIDDRYTKKVAEYQRKFFNGSAEDGFNAYINSMSNLESKAKDAIEEDGSLMKCARDSAEKQIKRLAKMARVNDKESINDKEPIIVWE